MFQEVFSVYEMSSGFGQRTVGKGSRRVPAIGRRFGSMAVVLSALWFGSTLLADQPPTLLGKWPLIENARDISGNGHDGVVKGGAVFSPDLQALTFDGVDGFVSFGENVPLRGSFTIAFWLSPDWPDSGKRLMRILGKFKLENNKILAIFADAQARLWCYISEDGVADSSRAILRATADPVIAESVHWYFVTVRWDASKGADGLSFRVNGVVAPSVAASQANISQLSGEKVDLTLGAFDVRTVTENGVTRDVVNNPFRGMMSGLSIWDGVLSDDAIAAQFGSGRTASLAVTPPGSLPPVSTPPPDVSTPHPSRVSSTLPDLLQNALSADTDPNYERAFAAKQQMLADLKVRLTDGKPIDLETVLRIATQLAPDLDEDQRRDLAQAIQTRFAPNATALLTLAPQQLVRLASALWEIDFTTGRAFVKFVFDNETVWKSLPARTLAVLAMLGGKQSGPEILESVLAPALLAELDKRLSAVPALTPEDCSNMALAWGGAMDGAKARVWALKNYQALLGTKSARSAATVETLRQTVALFRDARCWGVNNDYPEFRSVLLALAESGARWNTSDADLFALLIQTPAARADLRAAVETHTDARGLAVAKVLAAACARSNEIHAWWKELQTETGQGRRNSTYWRLVTAILDGKRVAGENSLRRVWHIERLLKQGGDADARIACLDEYADVWRQRGRPDVALERISAHAATFTGQQAHSLQTLATELDTDVRAKLREGLRNLKLAERFKLKRPPDPNVTPPVAASLAALPTQKGVAK